MLRSLQDDETNIGRVEKEDCNKLTVLKIDIDKSPQTATTYQVQGVPTLILFKNGEMRWRQSGIVTAAELAIIVKAYTG